MCEHDSKCRQHSVPRLCCVHHSDMRCVLLSCSDRYGKNISFYSIIFLVFATVIVAFKHFQYPELMATF